MKVKKIVLTATAEEISEGCNGRCIDCGNEVYGGVEPDACNYECEACGAKAVFGLEELLVMGMLEVDEEENEENEDEDDDEGDEEEEGELVGV